MEQIYLNWLYGITMAVVSIVIKWLWESHKELQAMDKELADKVSKMEVLVAGQYITRQEFDRGIQRIFEKLDHIEAKIQK